MATTRDTGYAPERWAFDDEVTRVFDDMLERSIPQYHTMRAAVREIAGRLLAPGTTVVDLGCSRGEALASILDGAPRSVSFVGAEVSPPMLRAARERFTPDPTGGSVEPRVRILDHDLRRGYPPSPVPVSVTLSVLTLMFVPINYRAHLLREAWSRTQEGGGLILVEKVLGATAPIDAMMVETYHDSKVQAGYDPDDVVRKAMALEGVLVPVTARWNEDMLRAAGFGQVDSFWRWMNFAGWVAVK